MIENISNTWNHCYKAFLYKIYTALVELQEKNKTKHLTLLTNGENTKRHFLKEELLMAEWYIKWSTSLIIYFINYHWISPHRIEKWTHKEEKEQPMLVRIKGEWDSH